MKRIDRLTKNIESNKELMKRINANTYTDVNTFIQNADRYIKAIKDRRMLCTIKSVSSSGMSRVLNFTECAPNKKYKTYNFMNFYTLFKHLGFSETKEGFRVHGCGMDMVFHTNYTIIRNLYALGFITKKECEKLCQNTPVVL